MTLADDEGYIWSTNSESIKTFWFTILLVFIMFVLFTQYIIPAIALEIIIPDSPAITQDNQNSNGIIVNQDLSNDAQSNYDNGIQIVKDSVTQDSETIPQQTTTTQTTSSSGGGGGGEIASSENFSNILKFEQQDGNLIKDKPVPFKFNLSIYEILLIGKENEYDVSVRVELLKNNSKATIKPDGEVIQYFNVITSSKRLKEAIIRFKTNQSSELLRWNGSEWVKLDMIENVKDIGLKIPQECIGDQPAKICYTYQTDSFSSFAIVKKPEIVPTSTPSLQANVTPNQADTFISAQETPKQTRGLSILTIIFIIFIVKRVSK